MVPLLALPEGGEWIVLLVIVVLLFGTKKLPELARNSARALVEFKKVTSGQDDAAKAETAERPPQAEVSAERPPQRTADNPPQA